MQDPLPDGPGVTELLDGISRGNRALEKELLARIYRELHGLARSAMRGERSGHTLQPTALVNEAYLRMIANHPVSWESRAQFYGAAARVMRQILIESARRKQTAKRDHTRELPFDEHLAVFDAPDPERLLAVDQVLDRLAAISARAGQIVELRFFAGFDVEETARALSISPRTVKREWQFARAWLESELGKPSL